MRGKLTLVPALVAGCLSAAPEVAPGPETTPDRPVDATETSKQPAAASKPSTARRATTDTPSPAAVSEGETASETVAPTSSSPLKPIQTKPLSASANIPFPQDI